MTLPIRDEDPRWTLKALLESYNHSAKLLIEKKKELEKATIPSEQRILAETMENIRKDFQNWSQLLYSFILSYNYYKSRGQFQDITDGDILNAQLIQDEVAAKLRENGINVEYSQNPNNPKD